MNTLKNVLFFGLLLAVLCGVYLSLNRSPEPTLPPGLSGDTTAPNIELGQVVPPVTSIPGPTASGIPGLPSQPPPMNVPPAGDNSVAPPFTSPAGSGGPTAAPPFQPSTPPDRTNAAPPWPPGGSDTLPPPPVVAAPATSGSNSSYPPGVNDPSGPTNFPQTPAPPANPLGPPPPADHPSSTSLDLIMQQVDLKIKEKRFADALLILSQLYGSPDLSASQARVVTTLLDQLGAKVIYSREYLLGSPYLVQPGDTLASIGDRYQVPGLLLAKINGICGPRHLPPGSEPEVVTQDLPPGKELKVFKGPFSAQISTDHSEMTLMLDGRYAGRFNVALSNDLSHAWGMCTVRDKRYTPTTVPGAGKPWMELGNASGNITMQGTNDTRVTAGGDSRKSIWLSEQDMDDVFGILSVGSRVIIQR